MPSVRNSTDEAILDAARDCVLAVGVRRTTLTDVARRAGLSRMTVYRAYPDVRTVVAELMTREFSRLLDEIGAEIAGLADARARLVAAIGEVVERLPTHPVFRRVVDVDPELLLPYVVERLGHTQAAGLALIDQLLRAGQRDGSIRALRGRRRGASAYCLLVAVQSFVLASGMAAEVTQPSLVADEVRRMVDRYLEPPP